MKSIILIMFICSIVLISCNSESKQVKMGRKAVYNLISDQLTSGEIKRDSHTIGSDGNVYWEIEYHFWSGNPSTQIAFMHFMSNGDYAIDITEQLYTLGSGTTASQGYSIQNK